MTDRNVTSLRGGPILNDRTPASGVIKALECALERAQAGDIQGIVLAQHHADGTASYQIGGFTSYVLIGAAFSALAELERHVNGLDD